MLGIVIYGVTAVVCGILGFYMAARKNRDASSWAAWCFILPPLVLALLLAPKSALPPTRKPTLDEQDKEFF
ncbi:MAG: hypothetical protein ACT4N2_09510 [Hyphomicrobium sp.]